jgi:hypothetical protein
MVLNPFYSGGPQPHHPLLTAEHAPARSQSEIGVFPLARNECGSSIVSGTRAACAVIALQSSEVI